MKICIVLLVLLTIVHNTSPALNQLPNLQAGTFSFNNNNASQSQLYIFQFNQAFTTTPQLALAISELNMKNNDFSTIFNLHPQAVTSTGVIVSWERQLERWIRLTITYIASLRTDLILGYVEANINQNSSQLTIDIKKNITTLASPIARVFLLGCPADGTSFNCGVLPKGFSQSGIILTIQVPANANGSLSISYVIFSPSTAAFASYGGKSTQQKFQGSFSSDIHKVIYQSQYILFGFSFLKFNSSQAQQISSQIDQNLIMTIRSTQTLDNYYFFYLVFGKSPKDQCINSTEPYQLNGYCYSSCPQNTYIFNYTNGGYSCKNCSYKLNQILTNGICVCKANYSLVNGSCVYFIKAEEVNLTAVGQVQVKSAKNAIPIEESKVENMDSLLVLFRQLQKKLQGQENKTIVNNKSQQSSSTLGKKIQIQMSNQSNKNSNQIQQTAIKLDSNNTTVQIHNNSASSAKIFTPNHNFDQLTESIVTQQAVNSQSNAINSNIASTIISTSSQPSSNILNQNYNQPCTTTLTLPTFTNNNQQCNDPNAFMLNGLCLCKIGYHNDKGICITIDTYIDDQPYLIPQNNIPSLSSTYAPTASSQLNYPSNNAPSTINCGQGFNNGLGMCVCQSGFYFDSGRCIPGTYCSPPSILNQNGACICPLGYLLHNSLCVKCSYPGVFDYNLGKCSYFCGQYSFYNQQNAKCECQQGYGIQDDNKCGTCSNKAFLVSGYCVQCPFGMIYNQSCQKCQCQQGTVMDSQGNCINRCGDFEQYNSNANSCICQQGYGRYKNRCALCPFGYIIDSNGICTLCPINQIFSNGKCKCKEGFVQQNKTCVSCQNIQDAFLYHSLCSICPIGYIKQGKVCILTSTNQQYQSKADNPQVFKALSMNGKSICGNGLIESPEQCDDHNVANGDGCDSRCKIQPGYTCNRMPSQCVKIVASRNILTTTTNSAVNGKNTTASSNTASITKNIQNNVSSSGSISTAVKSSTTTSTTPTAVASQSIGLQQSGSIKSNSNQMFLTLDTIKPYDFPDQTTMQNFMKAKFIGCNPPTLFCSQKTVPAKNLFDCLLIFPSGVPNKQFSIDFSYSYNGNSGLTTVAVDPIQAQLSQSNLRSNAKQSRNGRAE